MAGTARAPLRHRISQFPLVRPALPDPILFLIIGTSDDSRIQFAGSPPMSLAVATTMTRCVRALPLSSDRVVIWAHGVPGGQPWRKVLPYLAASASWGLARSHQELAARVDEAIAPPRRYARAHIPHLPFAINLIRCAELVAADAPRSITVGIEVCSPRPPHDLPVGSVVFLETTRRLSLELSGCLLFSSRHHSRLTRYRSAPRMTNEHLPDLLRREGPGVRRCAACRSRCGQPCKAQSGKQQTLIHDPIPC